MGMMNWVLQSVITIVVGSSEDHEGSEAYNKTNKTMMKNKLQPSSSCVDQYFQMPLHYPRYKKEDYEKMEEWRLETLLSQYGLCFEGTLAEKRSFAMGAFLWPDQL